MVNTDGEGRELRSGDGARVVLGALIKSGGAGSVYRVREQPLLVAKLYHASVDVAGYDRKVEAMLALSPDLPEINEGGTRYVQIAWPRALLRDARGRFVGYLMPAVDVSATSELECVLQEKQAAKLGLPTGLGAKMTLAANLSNVIAELHRQHHRVVDLKPVNLRFYPKSLYMAMLDCDGFSIQGQGERFEAPQFTIDYLAPEFQKGGLSAIGEEAQDRFALAVVVFQLINFGIHPYTGRPLHEHVPTDIPGRIAAKLYAYGQRSNPKLAPSPVSGHESMPSDLRLLFDRAFEGPGMGRPSPQEWGAALRPYAQRSSLKLVKCARQAGHQHFAGMPCAACARADLISKTASRRGQSLPLPGARAKGSAGARTGFGWKPQGPQMSPGAKAAMNAQLQAFLRANPQAPTPASSPYPAWANTPTQQWLWSLYARATPQQVFKTIIFAGIIAVMLIGQCSDWLARQQRLERQRQQYSTPAPAPAQPGSYRDPGSTPQLDPNDLQPIAVSVYTVGYVGPPDFGQIEQTAKAVERIALGSANNEVSVVERSMQALQRAAPRDTQQPPYTDEFREAQFRLFAGNALRARTTADREREFAKLRARIAADDYDLGAVCSWSWLAALHGRFDYARNGFLRAIWTNPQEPCGWLGFGSVADDTSTAYGALMMAERLTLSESADHETVEQLVERIYASSTNRAERWVVMDARARAFAATLRGESLPAEVKARAAQPLPLPASR